MGICTALASAGPSSSGSAAALAGMDAAWTFWPAIADAILRRLSRHSRNRVYGTSTTAAASLMLNLRFRRTAAIHGAAASCQQADVSDDAYALRARAEVGLSARSHEREHCSNAGWLSTVE